MCDIHAQYARQVDVPNFCRDVAKRQPDRRQLQHEYILEDCASQFAARELALVVLARVAPRMLDSKGEGKEGKGRERAKERLDEHCGSEHGERGQALCSCCVLDISI
jgi:hypothetical protein